MQSSEGFENSKKTYQNAKKELNDLSIKENTLKLEYEKSLEKVQLAIIDYQDTKEKLSIANSQVSFPDPLNRYRLKKFEVGDPEDELVEGDKTKPAYYYDNLAYLDSWANGWDFFINANEFSTKAAMIYLNSTKFTWGFLTLPIKMRFGNQSGGSFNFEQNLNFGLTLGLKHQVVNKSDVSMNYLFGISVVDVQLNNAIPGTITNTSSTTSTTTPGSPATSTTAISFSVGSMFQYDKFQIGLFSGVDFAGPSANGKFGYQGRPWIGFAIGISLFGEGKTTATGQPQK